MKTMRHVQTWLLITLLMLSASNDAWGKRLETNWNGNEVSESQTQGNQRGYTDHEHLDSIGLIHMNGRVYEAAEVARGIATGEITGQEALTTAGLDLFFSRFDRAFGAVSDVLKSVENSINAARKKVDVNNSNATISLSDQSTPTSITQGKNNGVEVNSSNLNDDASKGVPKPTRHSVNQKINREVKSSDELDAIKNPLDKRPIKTDSLGRRSQRSVGERAEVAVNPDTNKIVSVNPTSTKKAERLKRRNRNRGSD